MTSVTWSWKEIEIPTPIGCIRGKLWFNFPELEDIETGIADVIDSQVQVPPRQVNGSASSRVTADEQGHEDRFVALHGWQDNCGTFDRLIPLLLTTTPDDEMRDEQSNSSRISNHQKVTIAAIDLPGHGLSSHYPMGTFYTDLAFAIDLKRVIHHLGWDSFSLLGHSMGGYVSIIYASLFPNQVKRVITLDILKPLTFDTDQLPNHFAKSIDSFLTIECKVNRKGAKVPVYTKSEAVDRLLKGHSKIGNLSRQSAVILLKRGSKPVTPIDEGYSDPKPNGSSELAEEDHVVFTRDPRLQAIFFSRMDATTVKAYLKKLQCQMYVIKARNGIKLDEEDVNRDFISLYSSVCKSFKLIEVEGEHHVHLCDPDAVAHAIDNILSS